MKTCTKCGIEKDIQEFCKKSKARGGYQSRCLICAYAQSKAYRLANIEKVKEAKKKSYEKNAEANREYSKKYRAKNSEVCKEKAKKYYRENAEKLNARGREYYQENKDRISEVHREYRLANPDVFSSKNRRYVARKKGAIGTHTQQDVENIFNAQRGRCANCHVKLNTAGKDKYHVDHIIPLKKGGTNWKENLQCLCPFCNRSKKDRDPIDWANFNSKLI